MLLDHYVKGVTPSLLYVCPLYSSGSFEIENPVEVPNGVTKVTVEHNFDSLGASL